MTPHTAAANPRARLYAAVTLILLLAAAVRVLHIGDQALWIDEGATYSIFRLPSLAAMVTQLAARDHHPPVYYALLRLWGDVAGDSVVALRLFSALASILSVAAVFTLARSLNRLPGRQWFAGVGVGLLAMLMLALSDPEFVLAQDMRMYALRTLLCILSMIAYLRWVRSGGWRAAAAWVIIGVLLLHTQYQGLYICAVQGLHALLFLRGRQRVAAIGLLALQGALFAPWFFTYGFNQRNNDPGVAAALPSNLQTLRELRDKYLGQMWPLMAALLGLGAVALVPGAAGRLRIRWRPLEVPFILIVWIAITLIVTFVLNFYFPVLAPHRVLLMSPALAILIAQGLHNLPQPARGLLVGVLLVYGVVTVDDYYPKENWDEVAASFTPLVQPGEMALLEVYRGDYPLMYYLDHALPPGTPTESLRLWRDFRAAEYPAALLDELRAHPAVWLTHWSPDPSAFDFLAQSGFIQTARFTTDHWGNAIDAFRYDQASRFEAPPQAVFTSGMALLRAERGLHDSIHLWWRLAPEAEAPRLDYSVSVFLLDSAGQLVAQHDGFPQRDQRPTTGWQPGEIIYDPHLLPTDALPPGEYTLCVQVYTYSGGVRYPLTTGEDYATVGVVEVGE